MIFPFSIRFKKKLLVKVVDENRAHSLQYIQEAIVKMAANNVSITGDQVSYKGSPPARRWSLFGFMANGSFSLINQTGGRYTLIYKMNLVWLFIFAFVAAVSLPFFCGIGGSALVHSYGSMARIGSSF